jgi:ring-1,2-phenylacetyl-CoA epoxidase subunit PaaE
MLKFHALELVGREAQGEAAVCLEFAVPEELQAAYTGRAGQHIVLKAQLAGEEIRRTYSLVSAPGDFPLRIGVRLHDRGRMSRYLGSELQIAEQLEVLPPNGSFVSKLDDGKPHRYVAFVAGCGITPVLALMKDKLESEPACEWVLFYGNRNAGRVMFAEELLGLKDRYLQRLAVYFIMSREAQDVELFDGHIDVDKLRQWAGSAFDVGATDEFFLCGPDDMIAAVRTGLAEAGVEPARVHVEHFTLETVAADERSETTRAVAEGSAEVTVIMDGRRRSFSMALADETVLEAALSAGIDLPYSCCAGVCATCRTRAIKGSVEMADNFALQEWELDQGYVLACQSRPLEGELVLDYDDV